jgi:hypothetical protein
MHVPLQYQLSEYDCVPTAFSNAVTYLFERHEIPPMVIQHIYLYTLDTVGREARLGSGGTSRQAIQLLGHWLDSYKFRKFAVVTEFLEEEEVHLDQGSRIFPCLEQGGVALCSILLKKGEEHFLMMIKAEDGWMYCFDPYYRTAVRGLRHRVQRLEALDGYSANLRIRIEWMNQDKESCRFCLGPIRTRECLLIWRNS